jgi:hypothetical protein
MRRRTLFAVPALVLPLIFFTSCIIAKMMPKYEKKGMAIGGTYLLHKDAKRLDYAKYKVLGRSRLEGTGVTIEYIWEATRRITITKADNEGFLIQEYDVLDSLKEIERGGIMQVTIIPPEFRREVHIDRDGNLKKVLSNFGMSNWQMREIPPAKEGEEGFIKYQYKKDKIKNSTPAGDFITVPAWFETRSSVEFGNVLSMQKADTVVTTIQYVNDDVKFKTVSASMSIHSGFGTTLSPVEYVSLVTWALSGAGVFAAPAVSAKEMIESGFSSLLKSTAESKGKAFDINMAHTMDTTIYIYLIEQGNPHENLSPRDRRFYEIMDELFTETYKEPGDDSEKVELLEKKKGYKKYRITIDNYERMYEIRTK